MKLIKVVAKFFYDNYYVSNILGIISLLYSYYLKNNGITIGVLGFPFYFYENLAFFIIIFSFSALVISRVYFELTKSNSTEHNESNIKLDNINLTCDDNVKHIIHLSNESISRINTAIFDQNTKARINLLLGLGSAILGLVFIGFFIIGFDFNKYKGDLIQFLIDFIPRFGTLIVIETLAYFFLRLYKVHLDNIARLQSEATIIEHRVLAYQTAMLGNDKGLKDEAIKRFLNI